jgi:phospholipase/carboxylesterase
MSLRPTVKQLTIGDLDCVIVDPVDQEYEMAGAVILCHGFGAPGTDLVDCCRAMWQLEPQRLSRVRFVFPAGPLTLDEVGMFGARAWWMIDIERLNWMIATGEFRELRNQSPADLPQRRDSLAALIEWVAGEGRISLERIVLGGFSQGAMLTTDVALRMASPCGGLIVWSGTLLCEAAWKSAAQRQQKFPVFQSHGRADPILPFEGAVWLREMLIDAGFPVEFREFFGMHEIPLPAMRGAADLIAQVVS